MSADTLAERIRESAFRWITDYCNERKIPHFWNRPNDITIDTLAAFALSELSAAEKAARKEERELCCKDVCTRCDGPDALDKAVLVNGQWVHRMMSGDKPCDAAAIRNRE